MISRPASPLCDGGRPPCDRVEDGRDDPTVGEANRLRILVTDDQGDLCLTGADVLQLDIPQVQEGDLLGARSLGV